MPEVFETIASLRLRLETAGTIAFVPTMGALHEGHLALVNRAASLADTVVVSIFVNPLQFGEPGDLNRYPRDLDADLVQLPDDTIVFAPSTDELYPEGVSETRVTAGEAGERFEGASRPGHFDGMLTVVAKLLNIVTPNVVVFGQKDAQQVFLVRRMVRDLNVPVVVDVVQTVREADGLALSSRNRFLDSGERTAALALSRALDAVAAATDLPAVDSALHAVRTALGGQNEIELDYLELVDPETFLPIARDFRGPATAIVAARVGNTRLIDNRSVTLG
ncbi:MAG: pantoate--beta-alanine ligase [Microbacteriaceae bacterium]|nr:pantoate--beta-alanine ligase [Microbacteriaceae bacterium]